VEVVEPDARLDLMECPSPILPDQLMECGAAGCYECPPVKKEVNAEAEPVPKPLADLSGQELRDIYHTLVGKSTGQRHSPPFGTKEKLINEINRIYCIYDAEPLPEAEPVPEVKAKRPNYNHPNWPSPTTKRFAKHVAKYAGKDPKAIKTHEEALEFIAKRAKISVETLLNMSLKDYQTAHEPWSLVQDPWSPPNSLYFHCEL